MNITTPIIEWFWTIVDFFHARAAKGLAVPAAPCTWGSVVWEYFFEEPRKSFSVSADSLIGSERKLSRGENSNDRVASGKVGTCKRVEMPQKIKEWMNILEVQENRSWDNLDEGEVKQKKKKQKKVVETSLLAYFAS